MWRIYIFLLILLPFHSDGQAIDNTLSFKNINSDRYLRINYENDLFTQTDIYYTQGVRIDYVAPWIKRFPLSYLLIHPRNGYIRYGIGAEHDAYTPTSIKSDSILYGNRPYAACVYLSIFLTAIDTLHNSRFSATLSTGIIGPAAGGREVQTAIHRAINDFKPLGWQYQIKNDAVVNYQADYEKQLYSYYKIFLLDADGLARAGTLSDKASVGITAMLGYFDSPYSTTITRGKNFRIYLYDHPEISLIGYDATLQGGIFDRNSPYTVSANNITRVTFQNRAGLVINYKRIWLEYFQTYLSKEFTGGQNHLWGGLQIAFSL